jgi:hypothetical protein
LDFDKEDAAGTNDGADEMDAMIDEEESQSRTRGNVEDQEDGGALTSQANNTQATQGTTHVRTLEQQHCQHSRKRNSANSPATLCFVTQHAARQRMAIAAGASDSHCAGMRSVRCACSSWSG